MKIQDLAYKPYFVGKGDSLTYHREGGANLPPSYLTTGLFTLDWMQLWRQMSASTSPMWSPIPPGPHPMILGSFLMRT